jgi:hypothetical protein
MDKKPKTPISPTKKKSRYLAGVQRRYRISHPYAKYFDFSG